MKGRAAAAVAPAAHRVLRRPAAAHTTAAAASSGRGAAGAAGGGGPGRSAAAKRPAAAGPAAVQKRPASSYTGKLRPLAKYEAKFWREGFRVVAGTDEAGRGPLAGPVVAAAFAVLAHEDPEVLKLLSAVGDSKALKESERERLFKELTDPRFEGRTLWSIAEASVEEIDKVDILQAALSAMERAVRGLRVPPDCVLVDGCNRPPGLLQVGECWTRGAGTGKTPAKSIVAARDEDVWLPKVVEAVINGDELVLSIGAASILAKVHRDALMVKLAEEHPGYGFELHKGYATSAHKEALLARGVCAAHRRSFAPIRAMCIANGETPPAKKPRLPTAGSTDSLVSAMSAADAGSDGSPPKARPGTRRKKSAASPPPPPNLGAVAAAAALELGPPDVAAATAAAGG